MKSIIRQTALVLLCNVKNFAMPEKFDVLAALKAAIESKYGCTAKHSETVLVQVTTGGIPIWTGDVEVFGLDRHLKATVCYAWRYPVQDGFRCITVLKNRAINSAQKAVEAALFVDAQPPSIGNSSQPMSILTDRTPAN